MHSASIEFAPAFYPRPIRHVMMDWDGTTALSRTGWSDLMTDLYVEHLPGLPGEADEARREFSWSELMSMNGRPSIHQMAHLARLIALRGGEPADPAHYQAEFQKRLGTLVDERLARIRAGTVAAASLLLAGVCEMLTHLRERGITMSLVSGTPIQQLRSEAELLGVAGFFDGQIFGPVDTHDREFSKRSVIQHLLRENSLDGTSLLAFGDGPVELGETKAVGGLAVAVASDEGNNGSGRVDPWKRELLLRAGAHAVIADFRQPAAIMETLTK